MADLADYGIDEKILRKMYEEWMGGAPKSALEEKYLKRTGSHGKLFSNLVRRELGIETERRHNLAAENDRLREENHRLQALLTRHGIAIPDSK